MTKANMQLYIFGAKLIFAQKKGICASKEPITVWPCGIALAISSWNRQESYKPDLFSKEMNENFVRPAPRAKKKPGLEKPGGC